MLRRFHCWNLRHDAQEFLVAPTRRFLFEAFEFKKALFEGRYEQIVNRDVFSRCHFSGPAIQLFGNVDTTFISDLL
jgi:hypothetical protein